jgi:hypothetical protein
MLRKSHLLPHKKIRNFPSEKRKKRNGNATDQTYDVCPSVGRSTYITRGKYQCCNYYFLYFVVDVVRNMMSILR